jgi:hypothetical protein
MTKGRANRRRKVARKKPTLAPKRLQLVFDAAEAAGLLDGKTRLISARLPRRLVSAAKRRTGIRSDTELLVFAVAATAVNR